MASHWKFPVIVARHTHADVYDVKEMKTTRGGSLKMKFEPADGSMGWSDLVT